MPRPRHSVVSNAGGLNPPGIGKRVEEDRDTLGLHPKIACMKA